MVIWELKFLNIKNPSYPEGGGGGGAQNYCLVSIMLPLPPPVFFLVVVGLYQTEQTQFGKKEG